MKKLMMTMATVVTLVMGARAATTPIEISLICFPLSIPWCENVSGFRLDLLSGINKDVSGLDIGTLVNITEEKAKGLQICGFYNHIGEGEGIFQLAGLLNRCDGNYTGLQLAGIYNEVDGMLSGGALAAMNQAKFVQGLQMGIFNNARTLSGMQLGIVNFADDADRGVQVGIVNVMPNAKIPVSVIVNIGF